MNMPNGLATALVASLANPKHKWEIFGQDELELPDVTASDGLGGFSTSPGGKSRSYSLFSSVLDLTLTIRAKLSDDSAFEELRIYMDGGSFETDHAGLMTAVAALPMTFMQDRVAALISKLQQA